MQFLACVHTVGFPKRGTQAPREASQNAQETVAVSKELRDPAFRLMCMIVYAVCLSTPHTHTHHCVLCLWRPEESTDTLGPVTRRWVIMQMDARNQTEVPRDSSGHT